MVGGVCVSIVCVLVCMSCMMNYKKSLEMRASFSPFECGFDSRASGRVPFSVHFFLFVVLFLLFDVELVVFFSVTFLSLGFSGVLGFYFVVFVMFVFVTWWLEESILSWEI